MRKIIALLLVTLLVTSGMTFVYADPITASLIYVDDFESYDVGTYGRYQSDIGSIRDIGGMYAPGGISEGCTFEIVQEEGNKFLKVTVPDYTAFGVWFGGSTKYAYMTCDYKFPTAEGNTGFSICGNIWGTTYLNNVEGWPGTNPSTNTTATEWTQWTLEENKRLLDQSKYIAIAHGQGAGDKVICIDNIVVWEFNDAAGNTHNSSVPATVTFANSTGIEGDIAMPSAFSGIAWCNLYNAQASNCTVNLNNYKPTGAPTGKKFAGWSLTDGGNRIKDTMYSAFKIPSNITLYALWEKKFDIIDKEVINDYENDRTCLKITFNFPASKETAENLSNYAIYDTNILSVSTSEDGLSCMIEFDGMLSDEEHSLFISGVETADGDTIEYAKVTFNGIIRFKINGLNFYKDYGTEEAQQITDGIIQSGTISAVAENVLINTATAKPITIVAVLYKDDALIDIKFTKCEISSLSSPPIATTITLPEDLTDGNYKMKAFIIESIAESAPISNIIGCLSE